MARTTCQSFSISASPPGRSLLAMSSTKRRSSTFETHPDAVEADVAADSFVDGDSPPSRYLRCLPCYVVLLEPGRCSGNPKTAESFIDKSTKTFDRRRRAIEQ